jgi:hypothetical protein
VYRVPTSEKGCIELDTLFLGVSSSHAVASDGNSILSSLTYQPLPAMRIYVDADINMGPRRNAAPISYVSTCYLVLPPPQPDFSCPSIHARDLDYAASLTRLQVPISCEGQCSGGWEDNLAWVQVSNTTFFVRTALVCERRSGQREHMQSVSPLVGSFIYNTNDILFVTG